MPVPAPRGHALRGGGTLLPSVAPKGGGKTVLRPPHNPAGTPGAFAGKPVPSSGRWRPALGVFLLALAVGCPPSGNSGGPSTRTVDDLSATLEPFRADAGLPALAGAVFRGGTLVALGATGVRKLGDVTKVTTADLFHLGSDTKAMTATLVGLYVDRGRLSFSDTVAALFPGATIDPGYAAVTLDQLLQHRGGLPANIPPDIWAQMWSDGNRPDALSRAVLALLSRPPAQAPGTFVYANAGYMIAGAALERITGRVTIAGISSDRLYPIRLQEELAELIPNNSGLHVIDSMSGHDAFLTEHEAVGKIVAGALAYC